MKVITVGQLRQNPTAMLAEVESGATYEITRRDRVVGKIVPTSAEPQLTPAKRHGRSALSAIPRHEVQTASSLEDLLEDMRGEW